MYTLPQLSRDIFFALLVNTWALMYEHKADYRHEVIHTYPTSILYSLCHMSFFLFLSPPSPQCLPLNPFHLIPYSSLQVFDVARKAGWVKDQRLDHVGKYGTWGVRFLY
jgi:hypothetical protein